WWTVLRWGFSPDSRYLASAGGGFNVPGEVKLWDVITGKEVRDYSGHSREVMCVAFSPDGRYLASASGNLIKPITDPSSGPGEIKLWEVITGENLLTLRGHQREIASLAFSPDGRHLATAGWDRIIKVWNLTRVLPMCRALQAAVGGLSPGPFFANLLGPTLFYPGKDRLLSSQPVLDLVGHSEGITGLAFCPDGQRLASASADRTVKIWDIQNGKELRTLHGHAQWVNRVAFSPDGTRLV